MEYEKYTDTLDDSTFLEEPETADLGREIRAAGAHPNLNRHRTSVSRLIETEALRRVLAEHQRPYPEKDQRVDYIVNALIWAEPNPQVRELLRRMVDQKHAHTLEEFFNLIDNPTNLEHLRAEMDKKTHAPRPRAGAGGPTRGSGRGRGHTRPYRRGHRPH